MSYSRYGSNQYNNNQPYCYDENSNANNMTRSNRYNNIRHNNVISNVGNTNQAREDEHQEEEETRSSRITNEVIDHYSHEPMDVNRNNTVNSSVLRPNNLLQGVLSTGTSQEIPLQQNNNSEYAVYDNFIRDTQQNTARPKPPSPTKILTPPTAYNDVFIQNHAQVQQQNSVNSMFQVPTINVIQTPFDFTYPENSQLENQNEYGNFQYSQSGNYSINTTSNYTASQPYFNEEDYYHSRDNNSINKTGNYFIDGRYLSTNNLSQNSFSDAPSVISMDEDTRPILQQQTPSKSSSSYHFNNYNNANNLQDLENVYGYVDQSGDDYQIRSYLDNDGEMVNPYTNTMPVVYDKDEDPEDNIHLRNDNDMGYVDLGDSSNFDHHDTNTIDKSDIL